MKRIQKRFLTFASFALAAALVLGGCGKKETGLTDEDFVFSSYPVKTDVTLSYWVALHSTVSSVSENLNKTPFAQELRKRTGINVNFIHPPSGQATEQLNIMLVSDELPDIIEHSWYGFPGGPTKALEDGYIMRLNDIIESNSPNLSKYLKENPEIDKMVKTDSGDYYVYPMIRGDKTLLVSQGIYVRKDWLDDCGLEMPETMDEWHEALKQFKVKKGAVAPLSYQDASIEFVGAYGITEGFTVEDGRVVYGPYDARYKAFLKTFAQWFKEGLIDRDIAGVDAKLLTANILNGKTGVTTGYAGSGIGTRLLALREKEPNAILAGAPHVVLNKGEKPKIGQLDQPYITTGSAAIVGSCKNPEIAARLLDFGYSEEGHMLYNFGMEGVSYNMIDGYPAYTNLILNNTEGLATNVAMSQYIRGNTNGPFVQDPRYLEQYYELQEQKEAQMVWGNSDMAKYLLPQVTFTPEESSEVAEIMNNVKTFVEEKKIRYIMGLESIDTFDNYISTLRAYKIDRAMEIYQAAYERYTSR